jgi:serine/threonine-protein kinase
MITNPAKPSASQQGPTVDYRPTEGGAMRLPLRAAPGATSTASQDLQALLRRRMLFVALVFSAFAALALGLHIRGRLLGGDLMPPLVVWSAATAANLLVSLGLAGLLASSIRLSLRQLRGCELLLFGAGFGRYLLRQILYLWPGSYRMGLVGGALEAGESLRAYDQLVGMVYEMYLPWSLYLFAYGVLVPNTWRRCTLVVTILTLLPLGVWIAACEWNGVPMQLYTGGRILGSFLMLAVAGALAIYGSYRIASLQNEAQEARRLGQYTLREKIGSGGMGEVYRADHRLLRRPCAIKLMRPERTSDSRLLQRFEREVQATATLTHPNAVQVFDYGRAEDGTFYYVMEYLLGLTLEQLVERHGPLPPARAVHFLRQICGALGEAHGIGLLHRDLKPGNVMVCTRGGVPDTAKLLDFGLVLPQGGGADGDKLTQDGALAGTPAYMSPEQVGGQANLAARSDIYSLGALAYFLLTGQSPFAGRSAVKMLAAHLYEPPAPLTAHRADVPPDLEAVILKCLAKNPADRFPDVRSLEAALGECDTVKEWTEEDAAAWWQHHSGSEARTGSNQEHEEAGRTSRCT